MENIVLVDYGSGNVHSAKRALIAASISQKKEIKVVVTSNPDELESADRIVLPGVGHIASCRKQLEIHDGLLEALTHSGIYRAVPFLGICVGMQLMATEGHEDGLTQCLNWIEGYVTKITPNGNLRVPHMGWNSIIITHPHPVLKNLETDPHVYFVHSYAYNDPQSKYAVAKTYYGGPIVATVAKDNFVGTQFHPEKSQTTGLKILENFIAWNPS